MEGNEFIKNEGRETGVGALLEECARLCALALACLVAAMPAIGASVCTSGRSFGLREWMSAIVGFHHWGRAIAVLSTAWAVLSVVLACTGRKRTVYVTSSSKAFFLDTFLFTQMVSVLLLFAHPRCSCEMSGSVGSCAFILMGYGFIASLSCRKGWMATVSVALFFFHMASVH